MVNPTYIEIRDVLSNAELAPIVENKKHPRERSNEIEFRGRIRVQLKNEDGTPFKEEFKSRKSAFIGDGLLLYKRRRGIETRPLLFSYSKILQNLSTGRCAGQMDSGED